MVSHSVRLSVGGSVEGAGVLCGKKKDDDSDGGKLAGHLFFAENRENSSKGIAQEAGCQGLS